MDLLALYKLCFFKMIFKIRKAYLCTNQADGAIISTRTEAKRATAYTLRLIYLCVRVKETGIEAKTY